MNTMTNFLVQKKKNYKKFEVLRSDELKSDNETTSDRKAGRSGGYLGDTVSQGPCLRSHSMFLKVLKR